MDPYVNRTKILFSQKIREDIREICESKLSRKEIKSFFKKNHNIDVKSREIQKYRDLYVENCIKELSTNQKKLFHSQFNALEPLLKEESIKKIIWDYGKKSVANFIEPMISIPHYKKLEMFINMAVTAHSYVMPWKEYLLLVPSGRKLVADLFDKPGVQSMINFYMVIYAMQMTGAKFDNIYLDQMLDIIPYIDLPGELIRPFYTLPHLEPSLHSKITVIMSQTGDKLIAGIIGNQLVKILEYLYEQISLQGGEKKLVKLIEDTKLTEGVNA